MPKAPSGWALVTLDFDCPKCKKQEERVIAQSKRELQDCTKCGSRMKVVFPLGHQFDYATDPIKPFLDHVSPAVQDLGEAWITTKSQWRDRVRYSERMGYKQCYRGGGATISRKTLEEAENAHKVKGR